MELRQEEEYLRKEYQVYQEAEKLAVEKQNKEQFLISHPQPDVDEYSYHEEDYLIDDEDVLTTHTIWTPLIMYYGMLLCMMIEPIRQNRPLDTFFTNEVLQ